MYYFLDDCLCCVQDGTAIDLPTRIILPHTKIPRTPFRLTCIASHCHNTILSPQQGNFNDTSCWVHAAPFSKLCFNILDPIQLQKWHKNLGLCMQHRSRCSSRHSDVFLQKRVTHSETEGLSPERCQNLFLFNKLRLG